MASRAGELEGGWQDLTIARGVASIDDKTVVTSTSMEVEAGMGLRLVFLVGLGLVIRSFVLEGTFLRLPWEARLTATLTSAWALGPAVVRRHWSSAFPKAAKLTCPMGIPSPMEFKVFSSS